MVKFTARVWRRERYVRTGCLHKRKMCEVKLIAVGVFRGKTCVWLFTVRVFEQRNVKDVESQVDCSGCLQKEDMCLVIYSGCFQTKKCVRSRCSMGCPQKEIAGRLWGKWHWRLLVEASRS